MSKAFGHWHYTDYPTPTMINQSTGEKIVQCGPLASSDMPSLENWLRFEYRHTDLTYPLAIMWAPERQNIVIDHNLSADIWRKENQTSMVYPGYGTFVRVDDCIIDAILCLPEVPELLAKGWPASEPYRGIRRIGGWLSRSWNKALCVLDFLELPPFPQNADQEPKRLPTIEPGIIRRLDSPLPETWNYIDCADGGVWSDQKLSQYPDELSKTIYAERQAGSNVTESFWSPYWNVRSDVAGPDFLKMAGSIPQLRRQDGGAILYPIGLTRVNRHGDTEKTWIMNLMAKDNYAGSLLLKRQIRNGNFGDGAPPPFKNRAPWFLSIDFAGAERATDAEREMWLGSGMCKPSDQRRTVFQGETLLKSAKSRASQPDLTQYELSQEGRSIWLRQIVDALSHWTGTPNMRWTPFDGNEQAPFAYPTDVLLKIDWRGGYACDWNGHLRNFRVTTVLDDQGHADGALRVYRTCMAETNFWL